MTSIICLRKRILPVLALLSALGGCATSTLPKAEEPPLVVGQTADVRAEPVQLRPDHPSRYTVLPGDSLLDVAGRFLQKPWRWKDVWRPGSGRDRPDAIYPGEVIEFYEENGQPRLRPVAGSEVPIIKLSPQVRVETLVQPIPVVPRSAVESFLQRSIVVEEDEWEAAPHIIGGVDGRFILGVGDQIYVRELNGDEATQYRIFRPGEVFKDPVSGRLLGYNGLYVGRASVQEGGEPTRLVLTDTRSDVRRGDRLFPATEEMDIYSFYPKPAPPDTEGQIIALLGEALVASRYQTVVVNLGSVDGLEAGHMLGIFKKDHDVQDPVNRETVAVSSEQRTGLLMLYKVYERVSYALITEMRGPIRVLDRVATPGL